VILVIELLVKTIVHPTEDEDVIRKAISYLFNFPTFQTAEKWADGAYEISAQATGPETLYFLFTQSRKQRIIQTLHDFVLEKVDILNNEVRFMINKQVLTQRYIALCTERGESPLGPIFITIRAKDIIRLLNYLFPETEKGEVLEAPERVSE
jgi:predicted RNA binding protein with dsRBD fold (UPF0201 family)